MMNATKLLTLGALIGTCSFATAQDAAPAPAPAPPAQGDKPKRPHREVPAEMLKKFDTDGDGKLSPEEVMAIRAARQAEMLKKYDKDGDGKLSDDEKMAMQADMEAKRKALLEKYDADNNGKLSPDEIKTARDAGEEIPMGPMGPMGPGGPDRKRGGGDKPADASAAE